MSGEHPEFEKEQRRLEWTKTYLKQVIEAAEIKRGEFQGNIKQALVDLDHLDSSNSYVNILANANLMDAADRDLRQLKAVRDRPYFARLDFRADGEEQKESFYIGKTSLFKKDTNEPIMIDWRSPMANVYYEEQPGRVSYEAEGGTYQGEVDVKRQYRIDQGGLQDIRDIDITTRDDMLQASLEEGSGNRLKEIVATIQQDQNRIIRAELQQPLLVQGAAGSGKTTIALHRMAYVIYTHGENFDPAQMMVLAPNRLFLDYISDVLPELGVDEVKQTTFADYVQGALGEQMAFDEKEDKLKKLLTEDEWNEDRAFAAAWKGSFDFRSVLDSWIKAQQAAFLPQADVQLDRFLIFSAERMQELYEQEYTYLPPYRRAEKIYEVVKGYVKPRVKEILDQVKEIYENKIEKIRHSVRGEEERRSRIVQVMDQQEAYTKQLEAEAKTLLPAFRKQLPKTTPLKLYKKLMTTSEVFHRHASEVLEEKDRERLLRWNRRCQKQKVWDAEDAGAMLYLKQALFGIEPEHQFMHVFVDEAQDYSPLEMLALRQAANTNTFTVLGDLAQGIYRYRSLHDWTPLTEEIFSKMDYVPLRQSYRSTREIIHAANAVLSQLPEALELAEPVVRTGSHPERLEAASVSEAVQTTADLLHAEWDTTAVISRTPEDCRRLYEALAEAVDAPVTLIDESVETFPDGVVVVPAYLAKGLEFDQVFLVTLETPFSRTGMDIRLLYTGMTRALHELYLIHLPEQAGAMDALELRGVQG
ncbi:RNA polymerase recycling motor HelD [Alkalicoccus chagannorensis]|uniref:RNA polymerase recycling motor HelD n=1 Tax=Alkalicoccus chagannorensis TaxID=427072 RepID=UPI0003FF16D6|nr:RNA polymerase recycling motor HelD [Alkalicoccus chagannorensis]